MSGSIEDVGARLVLKNRAAFQSAIKATKDDVASLAKTTTKANADIAASYKATSDAQAEAAAKIKAASDAQIKAAEARRAAVVAAASGDKEAALAAKQEADALADLSIAAGKEAAAARANVSATKMQTAALKSSAAATDMAGASITRHAKTMGILTKASATLVKGGLLLATGAAYEGSKAFASYQQALEAVHTQAGLTQTRVNSLGKDLLQISGSGQIPETPEVLANQLYRIASSTSGMHYSNAKLIAMTKAAGELSVIGGPGTDPEQTARIIGGIRATGVKGAGNPQNIAALANATVGSGDLRMSDFVNFVGTGVLSSAHLSGVTLPQVSALLSLLGDNLQSGQVSGHSIAHGLQLLAAPSGVGENVYKSIGIGGTEIGNLLRTPGKGLTSALSDLTKHLTEKGAINPNRVIGHGMSAESERQFLIGYGFSNSQVNQAAKVGLGAMGPTGKTLEDMLLVHMFGGAKQSIPIMTAITEQPRFAAKLSSQQNMLGSFGTDWKSTMAEPANQLKMFDAQLDTFGVEIGSKVLPKLISFGGWLENNTGDVKILATAIGTLLVPATALYVGNLANKGISTLRGFNGETSKLGSTAEGQAAGLGVLGKSVMGVTAAIGIWELGKATAGHGAGGALTAGLGGAVTGMVIGFAVGGPFGAAVGAAAGALVGLAGHFFGAGHAASQATKDSDAFAASLKNAFAADNYKIGALTNQSISSFLSAPSSATGAMALASSGANMKSIDKFLTTGSLASGAGKQLQAAAAAGKITQAQERAGITALQTIASNFGIVVDSTHSVAVISGKVANYTKTQEQQLLELLNGLAPSAPGGKQPKTIGGLLKKIATPGGHHRTKAGLATTDSGAALVAGGSHIEMHQHFHGTGKLDPKEVREASKQGLLDAVARL